MSEKFNSRYRRESGRMKRYDYSSNGMYFITICAAYRKPYFGKLNNRVMEPTAIGAVAADFWHRIPEHFPFVLLDEFVLMPDHLHGILFFEEQGSNDYSLPFGSGQRQAFEEEASVSPGNRFGPQSNNLASVIRNYKGAVTSFARKNAISFGWLPRYHDRIIRSATALAAIRRYIKNNPLKG